MRSIDPRFVRRTGASKPMLELAAQGLCVVLWLLSMYSNSARKQMLVAMFDHPPTDQEIVGADLSVLADSTYNVPSVSCAYYTKLPDGKFYRLYAGMRLVERDGLRDVVLSGIDHG